jgi:hypothetical protein
LYKLIEDVQTGEDMLYFNSYTLDVGMHRILFLPDIRLIQKPDTGYPAGYPVRAGYRISGRILDLTTIFLAKYQVPVNFLKAASTITNF